MNQTRQMQVYADLGSASAIWISSVPCRGCHASLLPYCNFQAGQSWGIASEEQSLDWYYWTLLTLELGSNHFFLARISIAPSEASWLLQTTGSETLDSQNFRIFLYKSSQAALPELFSKMLCCCGLDGRLMLRISHHFFRFRRPSSPGGFEIQCEPLLPKT